MAEYKLIHGFKCTRNITTEFDVYDNQGLLSLETMQDDEVAEVYLSVDDELKLREILNNRHDNN